MTYSQKLLDPRWQKRRLEILQRDNFTCAKCGDDKSTLHVHHEMYFKGDSPWDAPDELLNTVCDKCHEIQHAKLTELETFLISCMVSSLKNGAQQFRIAFRNSVLNFLSKRK